MNNILLWTWKISCCHIFALFQNKFHIVESILVDIIFEISSLMFVLHLCREIIFTSFSSIHQIIKSLFDICLKIHIILSHFEQLHESLNTLNVLCMSLFVIELVVVLVSLDHLVVGPLHNFINLLSLLFNLPHLFLLFLL